MSGFALEDGATCFEHYNHGSLATWTAHILHRASARSNRGGDASAMQPEIPETDGRNNQFVWRSQASLSTPESISMIAYCRG